MHVAMIATGGPSGMPLIAAGLIGLGGTVFGLARARSAPNGTVRAVWITLGVLVAIISIALVFAGWVVEQLSNDPPL